MPICKESSHDLLLGIVAGGILGALAAALLLPKFNDHNGIHLNGMKSKKGSFIDNITQKGQEIAQGMGHQTKEWAEKTLEFTDHVLEELFVWEDALREAVNTATEHAINMREPEHEEQVIETLEWAQKTLSLAERVTAEINSWAEVLRETAERVKKSPDFIANEETRTNAALEFMKWATIGLNLWQNVKKRR